jgi:hypothetical protein
MPGVYIRKKRNNSKDTKPWTIFEESSSQPTVTHPVRKRTKKKNETIEIKRKGNAN